MFNIGPLELFALVLLGVLLFGKDLPSVGRRLGRTIAQFRRGLQDLRQSLDRDEDLREIKESVAELKRAAELPRTLVNPARAFRNLTTEALSSPRVDGEPPPGTRDGPAPGEDAASERTET
ncbi:MAG: hypothetical protein Fur0037_00520 [Planctomycetota bacterium]